MRLLFALTLAVAWAAPSLARPADAELKNTDPNKIVCRTQEVIGSRLQTKKACMTVMEWDLKRREERAVIERIQAFKPNTG